MKRRITKRNAAITAIEEKFKPGTLVHCRDLQCRRVVHEIRMRNGRKNAKSVTLKSRQSGYSTTGLGSLGLVWPYPDAHGVVVDLGLMSHDDEFDPVGYWKDSELYIRWIYPNEDELSVNSVLPIRLMEPYTKPVQPGQSPAKLPVDPKPVVQSPSA